MKNIFTIIIFLTLNVFSQNEVLETGASLKSLRELNPYSNGTWIPGKPLENLITGSTYLFPNWNGQFTVVDKLGTSIKLYNLNYNIKSESLESYISKDSIFQYDINKIDKIIKNDIKFKIITINNKDGLYQEIFINEKIKLYKGFGITVQPGVFNPLTQEKIEDDKFIQEFSYFFLINDKYEKTKLNKRVLLNILKDKKDYIKSFVSKYNLTYSKEEDVKGILSYYASLK